MSQQRACARAAHYLAGVQELAVAVLRWPPAPPSSSWPWVICGEGGEGGRTKGAGPVSRPSRRACSPATTQQRCTSGAWGAVGMVRDAVDAGEGGKVASARRGTVATAQLQPPHSPWGVRCGSLGLARRLLWLLAEGLEAGLGACGRLWTAPPPPRPAEVLHTHTHTHTRTREGAVLVMVTQCSCRSRSMSRSTTPAHLGFCDGQEHEQEHPSTPGFLRRAGVSVRASTAGLALIVARD